LLQIGCRDPNSPGTGQSGPADEGQRRLPVWPEYATDNPRYLEMRGPSDFVVTDSFRDEYCHMWRDINRQIQQAAIIEDARLT
jgi:hypothetical protein